MDTIVARSAAAESKKYEVQISEDETADLAEQLGEFSQISLGASKRG